jgi:hypothetical protein
MCSLIGGFVNGWVDGWVENKDLKAVSRISSSMLPHMLYISGITSISQRERFI